MTREEAWVYFAAGSFGRDDLITAIDAAAEADELLAEYDKRFSDRSVGEPCRKCYGGGVIGQAYCDCPTGRQLRYNSLTIPR